MQFPPLSDLSSIPFITSQEMRLIDKWMINELNISLIQMMENAGRAFARLCIHLFFQNNIRDKKIWVLAGGGGNGGGGMVAARHLSNWGAEVTVIQAKPLSSMKTTPRAQLSILTKMGVEVLPQNKITTIKDADLILDALIGYSLTGPPRENTKRLIDLANLSNIPIISLDIPSGIDATKGTIYTSCIHASATLTLALPKIGLRNDTARNSVGELYLADISVPPFLYNRLGYDIPLLFAQQEIIRLW